MNSEELAKKLNGRQYRMEMDKEDEKWAKQHDLVVVFGASDDLMEFRGAIDDEVDVYDGGTAYLDKSGPGIMWNQCADANCPYFREKIKNATTIEALWAMEDDICWTYNTEIPYETFEIFEDDALYCRGIVFNLRDVK